MSTFVGLAATYTGGSKLKGYTLATASLQQYAVVMRDSSASGEKVKAPTGAAVLGACAVLMDAQPAAGTTAGLIYNFAIVPGEIVPVLLDAGQAVTVGDKLVTSDTDGTVRAYSDGAHDNCTIIGTAEETRTAGATNEPIKCRLAFFDIDKS